METNPQPASLNDIFAIFGGLAQALAPTEEDRAAIKEGMDEMGVVMGALGEAIAESALEASHEVPTKDKKLIYEWVPMDHFDIPENAIPGAKDHSSEYNVYIARAEIDGHIRSGKVHTKYETVYIALDGVEKELPAPYEVLCAHADANVEWVECCGGDIPKGAVVGSIINGKKEYVGRTKTRGQISPGRIVPEDACIYAPYGGRDISNDKYEALAITNGSPLYEWVPVDSWDIPENAVPAAKELSDEYNIFLARVKLDGKLRFGKAQTTYRKVYVADQDGEKEIIDEPFEVLCSDPDATIDWVEVPDGKVPQGAVVGSIVDGKVEFIGRGEVGPGDQMTPGKITPADGCMYAPYGGKCEQLTTYQALVIQ